MKKPIIIVIGILLILGVLLFWSKSPSVSVSPSWETYENQEYHFSFQYPPYWELTELTGNSEILSIVLAFEDKTQEKIEVYTDEMYPSYSVTITVDSNEETLSAKDWYLSQFGRTSEDDLQEVTYGKLKGVKYPEGVAPASGPPAAILFATDSYFYRFMYSALATKETHEKYLPDFEKVLESIKILE